MPRGFGILEPTFIFIAILMIATAWVVFEQMKLKKRMTSLFAGSSANDVEQLLNEYLSRVKKSEESLGKINVLLKTHASHIKSSVQKVGFVRFNPFEDTGGDQSFSIALLDQTDSGLVITSMHGRAGTRIYAKPVTAGKSTHNLSEEERNAIQGAINSVNKEEKHV